MDGVRWYHMPLILAAGAVAYLAQRWWILALFALALAIAGYFG